MPITKKTKKESFKMPKWMECTWRRTACNKLSCRVCGHILKQKKNRLDKGEDPDDLEHVFEDLTNTFREAISILKKEADRLGIDVKNIKDIKEPPTPSKFSLYRKVQAWRKNIFDIADSADETESLWLATEAAEDIFWYANTLAGKTYRQLCNRWHINEKDGYGDFDYKYTQYVLKECLAILKKSLNELALLASDQKAELMMSTSKLSLLEKDIINI